MSNMSTISVLQGEICVSSKVDSERTQRIFGFIRAQVVNNIEEWLTFCMAAFADDVEAYPISEMESLAIVTHN